MAPPTKKQPPSAAECRNNAQMAAAASQKASANCDATPPDCAKKAEIQAVILYPALGTPHVAPVSEKKIRLFLIVEDKCIQEFGIVDAEAPKAWYYINTHLRIIPFKEASKTSADLEGEKLYSSPEAAKAGIKVWYKGAHGSEPANGKGLGWKQRLIDHDGHIVANVRESAITLFVGNALSDGDTLRPAFPSKDQISDTANKSLSHLFEIELGFDGLRVVPVPDAMYTLAWMVTCVYQDEPSAFKGSVTHWEHQDKLVYDFFHQMKEKKQHFAEPFAFDVNGLKPDTWPEQKQDEQHRIKPFHPFIFKSGKSRLDIGHVTDIHCSSRHFALARSDGQIIEGLGKPLGSKVVNCFASCKDIFDQFQAGASKADTLFITGDLLDFNRNLDPGLVPGKTPKEQWPSYNLSDRLDGQDEQSKRSYYPRGLDDMLMYSLIRRAYEKNLPVFMTTGNHEAYDEPFGISPRVNTYAAKLSANPNRRAYFKDGKTEKFTSQDVLKSSQSYQPKRKLTDIDPNDARTLDLSGLPNMTPSKANEGIPADHNLTIYEACLIYGPTFAQIMQSWNYMSDNYDWFFTLFTPLADFVSAFNDQILIGLEWGSQERMLEMGWVKPHGLLPRAVEAISDLQKALLTSAISRNAAQRIVFSHFTTVNYGQKKAYSEQESWDLAAVSDEQTSGTFEKGRETFLQWIKEKKITAHFAGHSHRSGGYAIDIKPGKIYGNNLHVTAAHDPAKQQKKGDPQLWVTSCGGAIGIQNLCGELMGWNLMPPSGSHIDGSSCAVKTVPARGVKPRFCVAVDYLQCHEEKDVVDWSPILTPFNDTGKLAMPFRHVAFAIPFIKSVTFHFWSKDDGVFDQTPMAVTHKNTSYDGTLFYDCNADAKAISQSLSTSEMSFVQIDFDDSLTSVTDAKSGARLYNQFDFSDPWVFRITIQAGNGKVKFHPQGEYPDWVWLSNIKPDRYPVPRTITSQRSSGR